MFAGYESPAKLDSRIWKCIYLFVIADNKSRRIGLKLGIPLTTSRHPSPGGFGGVGEGEQLSDFSVQNP